MINDRIHRLIAIMGMHPTSFSESIGVNVTVIFNIVKGRRSKPSFDLLLKILQKYDKVNSSWLIRGEGAMWNDEVVTSRSIVPTHVNLEQRVRMLVTELRSKQPESARVEELGNLIFNVLDENNAQKNELVLLHERQDSMLEVLREKLSINA